MKARLENAQSEQETLKQDLERNQSGISRIVNERDKVLRMFFGFGFGFFFNFFIILKACLEIEKIKEELERSQATLGKSQLQQDKLQIQLDKAQSEIDQLQEKYDRCAGDFRKVGEK